MEQSLSGIRTARMRLDAAAANLARMHTPGARAVRIHQAAGPEGSGVRARLRDSGRPIEPARELIEVVLAEKAVKANARFLQVGREAWKSVLDILA